MATFENAFHGPNYGTLNQAGRDMHVATVAASPLDALVAATKLRREIERLDLSHDDRAAANAEVAAVERELRQLEPDTGAIAARLERATRILRSAGAFASAGVALAGPIGVIAGILGPLGHVVADAMRS